MDILRTLLIIAVIGLVVWLLVTFIPMPALFRTLLIVAAVILIVFALIKRLGGNMSL